MNWPKIEPIQQFKIKGPNFIRQITYSPIDNNLLSAIGKGGETLREIMAQSKAVLKVEQQDSGTERLIEIYGDRERKEEARNIFSSIRHRILLFSIKL